MRRTLETVRLDGFAELDRQLRENLPASTGRGVLQRAGKKAMEPMRDHAIELAPERTGATKRTIRIIVKFLKASSRFGAAVRIQLGAGDRKTFWPRFHERGTVKMPAHPFMRPAFDGGVVGLLALLKAEIRVEIDKAVVRRAKRLAKKV